MTPQNYGRDHHPRCFTVWLSGGGVKPGISLGETDDYCYNVVKDPVQDVAVLGEYLETVLKKRRGFEGYYASLTDLI